MGNSGARFSAGNAVLAAVAGITAGLVAVLVTGLVVLAMHQPEDSGPRTQAVAPGRAAQPTPVPTVPLTPRPSSTAASVKAFGDVRELPVGLLCRDLRQRGYGYAAAVDYWRIQGQPRRLDADRNGIPCEPEYPRADVGKYWQGRKVSTLDSVPDGLLCRDLAELGASYGEAVTYWWYSGMPDRLDSDRDGVPCEQVYAASEVEAFWRQ
ncbi:hypothetical protein [Kribbella lupini]|uniref:Excalibur calcium-binding domain-containing protein n=1 Tax=Kribbella lupini TaxID=291602 RepID=A0ABP4MAR0_9ACTN